MLRKKWKIQIVFVAVIATTGLLYAPLLLSAGSQGGADCNASAIVEKVQKTAAGIKDYSFKSRVTLDGKEVLSQIGGRTPDLLKISMDLSQGSRTAVYNTVFDGSYQWIETRIPSVVDVSKIKLKGLVKPGRPFDTSYTIMGSGLLSGEDYPATVKVLTTVYKLKASCSSGQAILQGSLDKQKFAKFNNSKLIPQVEEQLKSYADRFRDIKLAVNLENYLLESYSVGSKEKPDLFSAKFENVRINTGLKRSDFSFVPPKGMPVIDVTKDVLSHINSQ